MDQIDLKILALLRENGRMPLKKIAEQVFLSSPAVAARMERLEEKGVIQGYRAIISPEALGQQIQAFIHVVVPPEQQGEFAAFAAAAPQITACYHVTGAHSMLVQVRCAAMTQLDQLVARMQHFGTTQTQVVLSTVVPDRN